MAPKPFPLPVGIGVDICQIRRLSFMLNKQDDYVTRWAKKVFTRREWPSLWQSFHRAVTSSNTLEAPKPQLLLPYLQLIRSDQRKPSLLGTHLEGSVDIAGYPWIHEPPPSTSSMSEDKWRALAQHIAGRWAAKEATIKASRQRRLFLKDISIVQCNSQGRVHALIAPQSLADIVMNPEVAMKRGLFEAQYPTAGTLGQVVNGRFIRTTALTSRHNMDSKFFLRKARIKDDDQQAAEISISHDGDYAVAVCMALDEKSDAIDPSWKSLQCIVDDGSGKPFHEPEWGDSGYFEDGKLPNPSGNE